MGRQKYNAIKTVVDGIKFDSKAEARRYGELKLLVKAKLIFNLELQPPYVIMVNDMKICTYKADFRYKLKEDYDAPWITEDVKGMKTAVYNLKKKLMKACHGIDILETK